MLGSSPQGQHRCHNPLKRGMRASVQLIIVLMMGVLTKCDHIVVLVVEASSRPGGTHGKCHSLQQPVSYVIAEGQPPDLLDQAVR